MVYIREAHPTDGWQVAANEKDKILLTAPKTVGQKQEYASACVRNLGIKFRSAVDGMDHLVESDYSGWPDRLYLIGKDGRVAWKGRPGPQGSRPQELEAAVRKELGT